VKRRIQKSGVRSQKAGLFCVFASTMMFLSSTSIVFAAEPDYTRTFVEASKAYDENRLPEAIQGWSRLVEEGQNLPAVLFNLGNATYRNGNLGEAILAYRHAQTLAPRDPDIRANLGFAAQTAGISLPERNLLMSKLLEVSKAEWTGMATLCYWLLFNMLKL
jgi:Flp pilus assembly protein TadD